MADLIQLYHPATFDLPFDKTNSLLRDLTPFLPISQLPNGVARYSRSTADMVLPFFDDEI